MGSVPVNLRRKLLASTAAQGLFAVASTMLAHAQILPQGGQVVAGAAQIRQTAPTQLSILQSTDRAAITWQSFSIGSGSRVDIQQPSATSISLNEVIGINPSQIFGALTSNGRVVIANPNGIWFGATAQVDVAGIAATTARPAPTDIATFAAGGSLNLSIPGQPNASIVNDGRISVAAQGLAAFVAPGVRNSGVIAARLGQVQLASGTTATLDFRGDGLINLAVTGQTLARALGPDGKPLSAAVGNSGTIAAAGGTVMLTANVARGVVDNVINTSGVVAARAVSVVGGEIVLDGGDSGTVAVSGTLDVSGRAAGQVGGTVEVLGNDVQLAATAMLDASGDAGGGTVLVGGNFHGAGPERNATATSVATGARILADAVASGNGGAIAVWSNGVTSFDGTASARGGAQGGNGGSIETSGESLAVGTGAVVDAGATAGQAGTWLLDPASVSITTAASSGTSTTTVGTVETIQPSSGVTTTNIQNTAIQTALVNDDVVIVTTNNGTSGGQAGNITVSTTVTWATAHNLTLEASGNITFGAASDTLHSTGGGGITLAAGVGSNTGSVTVGATLTTTGGVSLSAGSASGSVTVSRAIAAGVLTASGASGVTLGLSAGSIQSSGGQTYASPVTLSANTTLNETGGGTINFTGSVTSTGTSNLVVAGGAVTFGDVVNVHRLQVQAATLDADVTTAIGQTYTGAVSLGGDVTLSDTGGSAISFASSLGGGAHNLTVTDAGGKLTLTAGANDLGTFDTTGTATTVIDAGLDAASINANAVSLVLTAGSIATTGGQNYAGTLTLGASATLSDSGGGITFQTVTGTATRTLTVSSGTTTLSGNVTMGALSLGAVTLGATPIKISTSTGNGAVNLGTIAGNGDTLTVTAGSGAVTLNGVTAGALTLTTTGGETLDTGTYAIATTPYSFTSTGGIHLSGNLTFGQATRFVSAVTLTGNASLSASSGVTFASTIGGAGNSLTVTAGTTTLSGNVTLGALSLGAVTLAATPLTLNTSAGGGSVSLGQVTGTGDTLVINTGAGALSLGGVTATALTLTTTGPETLDTGTYTIGTTPYSFASSGGITLSGNLTLGHATTFASATSLSGNTSLSAGSGVTFGSTVSGAGNALTITGGPVTFDNTVTVGALSVPAATLFNNVTSSGGQSYGGAATLAGTVILTDNAAAPITFSGTLTGNAHNLTVNDAGGTVTLTSGATSLGAFDASGAAVTLIDGALAATSVKTNAATLALSSGSIVTSGGATYSGAVTLGTNITFADSGPGIAFLGAVTGAGQTLTVTTGASTFGSSVTIGRLLVQAATLDNSITTTGGQTYSGASSLGGDAVLIDNGGAPIAFNSTLAGNAHNLTVIDGPGTLTLTSGATSLGAFDASGAALTLIDGALSAASLKTGPATLALPSGSIATTGGEIYSGAVTLGTNITLSDSSGSVIMFLNTLAGTGKTLTVTNGATTFVDSVTIAKLAVQAATLFGSVTTTGGQSYGGAVSLSGNVVLTDTAGAPILFAGGVSGNAHSLTVNDTGTLTLTSGATNLGAFDSSGAALTVIDGSVTAASVKTGAVTFALGAGSIATTAGQTYGGAVTLATDALLSDSHGSAILFAGTIDGAHSLTVSTGGVASFGGPVGNGTPLANFAVSNPAGTTALDGGSVATSGGQNYANPVSLGADTSLNASAGAILFNGQVTGPGFALTASAPSVSLSGVTVGDLAVTGSMVLGAGSYLIGDGSTPYSFAAPVQTSGAVTLGQPTMFGGAVTLAGNTTLAGPGDIGFGSTVDGAHALSVNTVGLASFAGAVGAITPLTSLTIANAGGTTALNGASIATSALQIYANPVTLGANVILSGSGVSFSSTVTGAGTLTASSGAIALSGASLGGLAIAGTATLTSGTYAVGGGSLTFAGPVILNGSPSFQQPTNFAGAVTLSADAVVADTAAVGFAGTIDGAHLLTVGAPAENFGAAIGAGTPLTGLAILGNGGTTTLHASVTTAGGGQSYGNALVLAGSAITLGDSGGGAIAFLHNVEGTASGAQSLTVDTAGATSFAGPVGDIKSLAALTTDAPGTASFGNVTTTGAQAYNDQTVTLDGTYTTANATLQVPHSVIFTGSLTVDSSTSSFGPITPSTGPGTVNLTFNLGGANNLTFNGDAGGDTATRLGNLIVNGGASLTINPGFTVYVMTANLSSSQINLGDTLNVLNGVTITGAQSVTGDIVGSTIQISAASATVNAMGSQSISVTAGSIAGSFAAPVVDFTGPTVTGDVDAQSLTVTNADVFTGTGTIDGQDGSAAATQIVFVGGTAGTTGTFNGINVSTGIAPGSDSGPAPVTGGSGSGTGTGSGTSTGAGSGTGPGGGSDTGTASVSGTGSDAGTTGGGSTGTGGATGTGAGTEVASAGTGTAPETGAIDVQTDANHQIVAPLATVLADPGAPLGVGAGAAPAAGGDEDESDEDRGKKAATVTPAPIDSVYDYANKFLDGTLKRP